MAKQTINNGDSGLVAREAINDNFTEIYTGQETVDATAKTTPVDADVMPIQDSADSDLKKKVTFANIKATLLAYFSTIFSTVTDAFSKGSDTLDNITDGSTYVKSHNDYSDTEMGKVTANSAKVSFPEAPNDGSQYARKDEGWEEVSAGAGDMLKSVYDPNTIEGDAFDMDEMAEGATNKILTASERTTIGNQSGTNTGDETNTSVKTKYELNANTNAYTDTEKSKLAGIEAGAEVNVGEEFTSAEKSKLTGIEAGATTDQTGAEIKVAYESEANTNAFTDSEKTNLGNQSGTNTGDETAGTIKTKYESNADTNAFTDAEKTLLSNQSGENTGDQDLSSLATKANVLELDNTTAFTPDADYEPATKKYVDDNAIAQGDVAVIDVLTQAQYDALTPVSTTLYLING